MQWVYGDVKWKWRRAVSLQATEEKEEAVSLRVYNAKLVDNILPAHVATHFLTSHHNTDEVYSFTYFITYWLPV